MLNVESALAHLNSNASEKSHGNCAKFVRLAIKAGGVNIISPPLRPNYDYPAAADYGASLLAKGFTIVFTHNTGGSELTDTTTIPGQQAGDVVVVQDIPGHRYGHMAMFNGTQWVSDFRQPMGFYPARAYSSLKSAFKMYRYGETEKNTPSDQSNVDNKDLHICYPITKNPKGNEFGNAEEILAHLGGEPAGFYLVGRNGMWHGGIHISSVTTPWSALSGKGTSESVDFPVPYKGEQPLRCMADGEVVAYRVCKDYLEAPWTSGILSYSGSFVLIRHYLQPGDDKKSSLTFYTLYMHLAPWSAYQAGKGKKTWKVNERKGLSAYEDADRTVRKGTLPNGTKVRWDETDEGFKTQTDKGRIYGNVTLEEDVIVKARGNTPEKKLFSQGDQVWVVADRTNLKTTEPVVIPPAWWAHFQPQIEEKLEFEQVTCPVPFRINAKDPVGHLGYYQNPVAMGYVPRYQSHIECFSIDENLPTFLTNPEKLEQEDRPLFLKYTPGLPRYNKNLTTGKFAKEAEATRSTGIATLKKVKSVNEKAADDKSAETYFQIYPETAWLAKKDVKLLSRYDLAELGFTLTDDSPGNFDKLDGKTPPETLIRKILDILHNAAKQDTRVDYALLPKNYQRLIDMISTNSDGYYSPDEYRQAIHNPILRDTLFRIIAKHPSEWFYKPTDSLWISYLEKLTQDAPEWKKYNESVIEKLVWMQDMDNSKVFLGSALYHMHPIVFLDTLCQQEVDIREARVRAVMRMLRVGEGTVGDKGYELLFGGESFIINYHKDFSTHPQIPITRGDLTSTAAGAYQVMGYNWTDKEMVKARIEYSITDFTPLSQDKYCVILLKIKRKKAWSKILSGDIEGAINIISYEWASLPPGRYGQPAKSMSEALYLYENYLKEELSGSTDLYLPKGYINDIIRSENA
ncbi:hypothetical protein A9993_25085 [Rahnella victoriana]|jgi:muramidase (phage lysozyme)|uniref:glycoside hydrolase family 24 protein n=1 Tax=Rahnella victoriana TaxID=1510570 RepID=UPI000BB1E199|nr:glycoside hydrolase family 104 protein [Rahnella victoriana]PBI78108.1 hypothetical protein A9993_25085 [Rahnella victoriana]